jgi:ATP-dependent RNA helicase DDX46/PRP5
MIATSVAGRGLDVPDIVCVINYNCPNHVEDYVHRVGRTGRAGRKGTAYTFISSREDQYAPSMVKLLQKAHQKIPKELLDLSQQFKTKVSKGEAQWSTSGFEGKGYTFDANEMNESQKVISMQRKAYEKEQGLLSITDGNAGDDADDEDDNDTTRSESIIAAGKAGITTTTTTSAITGGVDNHLQGGGGVAFDALTLSKMTPLERAKALASTLSVHKAFTDQSSSSSLITTTSLVGINSSSISTSSSPIYTVAALARAKLIALQMQSSHGSSNSHGNDGKGGDDYFADELDINDYPPQARRKISIRSTIEDITDRTGVAVISRGIFIPPGKKIDSVGGERRLHLVIEGTNEMSVRQAKLEIQKILDDETIRLSNSGNVASMGRYSVL